MYRDGRIYLIQGNLVFNYALNLIFLKIWQANTFALKKIGNAKFLIN